MHFENPDPLRTLRDREIQRHPAVRHRYFDDLLLTVGAAGLAAVDALRAQVWRPHGVRHRLEGAFLVVREQHRRCLRTHFALRNSCRTVASRYGGAASSARISEPSSVEPTRSRQACPSPYGGRNGHVERDGGGVRSGTEHSPRLREPKMRKSPLIKMTVFLGMAALLVAGCSAARSRAAALLLR